MSSKNPQSDYDQALDLKNKGNECFKSGDLKGALKHYSRIFMHIGMNPCMNMSQMMGAGGNPNVKTPQQTKDPLQQKTDALRLTAFNNMAAVYAKMNKWDDCKEKCSRVLKVDDKNTKALFRRGMAHRKLNLYELARADLEKAKEVLSGKKDPAIEREMKLLNKDEKNADKEFYAKMKKQMQKANKKKKKKKAEKEIAKQKQKEEEMKRDNNPNIKANIKKENNNNNNNNNNNTNENDDAFTWDIPENDNEKNKGNKNENVSGDKNKNESTDNNNNNNTTDSKDALISDKSNDKSVEQPSEF